MRNNWVKYLAVSAMFFLITACGVYSKKEQPLENQGTPALEVPPDLVLPEKDSRMDIPPVNSTFSDEL